MIDTTIIEEIHEENNNNLKITIIFIIVLPSWFVILYIIYKKITSKANESPVLPSNNRNSSNIFNDDFSTILHINDKKFDYHYISIKTNNAFYVFSNNELYWSLYQFLKNNQSRAEYRLMYDTAKQLLGEDGFKYLMALDPNDMTRIINFDAKQINILKKISRYIKNDEVINFNDSTSNNANILHLLYTVAIPHEQNKEKVHKYKLDEFYKKIENRCDTCYKFQSANHTSYKNCKYYDYTTILDSEREMDRNYNSMNIFKDIYASIDKSKISITVSKGKHKRDYSKELDDYQECIIHGIDKYKDTTLRIDDMSNPKVFNYLLKMYTENFIKRGIFTPTGKPFTRNHRHEALELKYIIENSGITENKQTIKYEEIERLQASEIEADQNRGNALWLFLWINLFIKIDQDIELLLEQSKLRRV